LKAVETPTHPFFGIRECCQPQGLKYQSLATTNTFITLAFETLGPINTKGVEFFNILGPRLTAHSGDMRQTTFLFRRLSLTVQRFNAVCFKGSFSSTHADSDT
jgi:hypothetical protein